ELVFFPEAAPSERLEVERIDIQALNDTGLAAEILIGLAQDPVATQASLSIDVDAATMLADGLTSYALLLLRLGGLHARLEHAEHLLSKHLRAAGKSIASGAAPPDPFHPSAAGAAAAGALFVDITDSSGVDFRHRSSDWIAAFRRYGRIAPTFSGGGVTVGNVDDDSLADLILCGGTGCRLYRGQGNGSFVDATVAAGINVPGEARMAVLADFDNDADLDLFLTYARDTNRLFENAGNGRFEDVTAESGLARDGDISGPACAVDVDNDGLLDIYVGNFGNYLAGENPWSPNKSINGQPNRLYRNLGGLMFEDVTETAGVGNTGWTQALSHVDADRDGDQDLYIANDFGANEMFLNRGDGTFEIRGEDTGSDDDFHGMNVSFTDLNRDGYADVFVTNIWFVNAASQEVTETNTVLVSQAGADGVRYDRFAEDGFLDHDTGWAWGAAFLDVDKDADDDLFVANGFTDYLTFIQYRPHPQIPNRLYAINNGREANYFFRNEAEFATQWVPDSGLELFGYNSRSAVAFDLEGDHDPDLVVTTFHDRARLFRNDAGPQKSGWLEIELEGDPNRGVNRDAIGSQITIRGDGDLYIYRTVTGGEGYLSMSALPTLVGLGEAETVDIEILWPDGSSQMLTGVSANQKLRIVQSGTNG
ncbi:MAG: CRTAC1 family protein, partial [Thermoanaerobaculia bacterium]